MGTRLGLEALHSLAGRFAWRRRMEWKGERSVMQISTYRRAVAEQEPVRLRGDRPPGALPLAPLAEPRRDPRRACRMGAEAASRQWPQADGGGSADRLLACRLGSKGGAHARGRAACTFREGTVHAVRIGDGVIVSGPGEVFTEIGMAVKEREPWPPNALRGLHQRPCRLLRNRRGVRPRRLRSRLQPPRARQSCACVTRMRAHPRRDGGPGCRGAISGSAGVGRRGRLDCHRVASAADRAGRPGPPRRAAARRQVKIVTALGTEAEPTGARSGAAARCSPLSPQPGAATSRRRWNGEQSKATARGRTPCGSTRRKAAGLANTQTEVDVATFTQWINAYAQKQRGLDRLLLRPLPGRVQAGRQRLGRTRPLKKPERPPHAVRDAPVQARSASGNPSAFDAEAEIYAAKSATRHPARVELRAGRRPLRLGALLRGHEHQAVLTENSRRHARARLRSLSLHRTLDRHLAGHRGRLRRRRPGARRSARREVITPSTSVSMTLIPDETARA